MVNGHYLVGYNAALGISATISCLIGLCLLSLISAVKVFVIIDGSIRPPEFQMSVSI